MNKPLQPFDKSDTAYAQNGNNLSGAQSCRQSYHERAWVEDKRDILSLGLGLDGRQVKVKEDGAELPHRALSLPFLPRTTGISDSHMCVKGHMPHKGAGGPSRASWEVKSDNILVTADTGNWQHLNTEDRCCW